MHRNSAQSLANSGGYQSGQMGQTVNLLVYTFGGSNPSPPTYDINSIIAHNNSTERRLREDSSFYILSLNICFSHHLNTWETLHHDYLKFLLDFVNLFLNCRVYGFVMITQDICHHHRSIGFDFPKNASWTMSIDFKKLILRLGKRDAKAYKELFDRFFVSLSVPFPKTENQFFEIDAHRSGRIFREVKAEVLMENTNVRCCHDKSIDTAE